jgi:hypothetical protein
VTFSAGLMTLGGALGQGEAYNDGREIDPTVDWSISVTFQYFNTSQLFIGIIPESSPNDPQRFVDMGLGPTNTDWFVTTLGDADSDGTFSPAFAEHDDMTVDVVWDQGTTTLTVTVTQDSHVESLSSFDPYPAGFAAPYYPFIYMQNGDEPSTVQVSAFTVTGG